MNIKENKKEIIEIITYTVLLIFILFNLNGVLKILKMIISLLFPFILGAVIAFVLNVLLNIIENKLLAKIHFKKDKVWLKIKRPLSLISSLLLIILVLFFIFKLVIPELHNAAILFTENIPEYVEQTEIILKKAGLTKKEITNITASLSNIQKYMLTYLKNNSSLLISQTIGVASSLISIITNFVIALVFAIYILSQKEVLSKQTNKIVKAYFPKKVQDKIDTVTSITNQTFSKFISGQCLEAVIIGLLCFVGMLILQMPYALTISVLVGFTALIPVFGAFIGTIIGAFLIFMISPVKALVFVIFIIILQQIEGNLIYPKVVGKSVGLPGLWVIVAVTVGASLYGIVGMLVSVPLCSIIYNLFAASVNKRLTKKKD